MLASAVAPSLDDDGVEVLEVLDDDDDDDDTLLFRGLPFFAELLGALGGRAVDGLRVDDDLRFCFFSGRDAPPAPPMPPPPPPPPDARVTRDGDGEAISTHSLMNAAGGSVWGNSKKKDGFQTVKL